MADQVFDDGELIDESGFQRLARQIGWAKDRLTKVVFKNNKGSEAKKINSMDGRRLQVVAGVVEMDERNSNDVQISIPVKFATSFSGKHPAVVAMPDSAPSYGVSIGQVDGEGFVLNIRKLNNADRFGLRAIHYIAIGKP